MSGQERRGEAATWPRERTAERGITHGDEMRVDGETDGGEAAVGAVADASSSGNSPLGMGGVEVTQEADEAPALGAGRGAFPTATSPPDIADKLREMQREAESKRKRLQEMYLARDMEAWNEARIKADGRRQAFRERVKEWKEYISVHRKVSQAAIARKEEKLARKVAAGAVLEASSSGKAPLGLAGAEVKQEAGIELDGTSAADEASALGAGRGRFPKATSPPGMADKPREMQRKAERERRARWQEMLARERVEWEEKRRNGQRQGLALDEAFEAWQKDMAARRRGLRPVTRKAAAAPKKEEIDNAAVGAVPEASSSERAPLGMAEVKCKQEAGTPPAGATEGAGRGTSSNEDPLGMAGTLREKKQDSRKKRKSMDQEFLALGRAARAERRRKAEEANEEFGQIVKEWQESLLAKTRELRASEAESAQKEEEIAAGRGQSKAGGSGNEGASSSMKDGSGNEGGGPSMKEGSSHEEKSSSMEEDSRR